MFHTLFDYQDQNVSNNRQIPKCNSKGFDQKSSKGKNSFGNYYGQGNNAYDVYNKNDIDNNNSQNSYDNGDKFEKTTNKVKLIVYKNGFILNNGPFRDTFIAENKKFLEQVERGVIPHELSEKGISDLGILLINRKSETYQSNNSLKYNNSFKNFDFFKYPSQKIGENKYNICQGNNNPKIKRDNNIIPLGMSRIMSTRNIQIPKKIDLTKYKDKKVSKKNCSEPKKYENENEKEKKFRAFSGAGRCIKNVNIQGLHVNKDIKTIIDIYQPVCTINIRLFNGEVAKCDFNYTQTLRDIYYHVRRISGSNNFYLLDGFPPRPLRDYDRTIYELGLQNSMLTQRIN